jgi:molecular chaperone GrpE
MSNKKKIDKKIGKKKDKKVKEKKLSREEYKDKYLRALADYQNLVKRSNDEKMEFVKYANKQLLYDILPVYDNLKVSLQHFDKEAENSGWVTGIKYVVKQFRDFLEGVGVEEIKTVGEKFDHNTMEVLKGKGEKVIKELKSGYKLKGKVVVAAKVEVE